MVRIKIKGKTTKRGVGESKFLFPVGKINQITICPMTFDEFLLSSNRVLYDNYPADMELYQASPEAILRSRALFSSIYRELNKESKNFTLGLIEEKSKVIGKLLRFYKAIKIMFGHLSSPVLILIC